MAEIVPPNSIKRIILTKQSPWLSAQTASLASNKTQPLYHEFLAHCFTSAEKTDNWALGANERTLAELIVLTTGGQMFYIEILSTIGKGGEKPSAVLIHGRNQDARLDVKDFKFKSPKQ